MKPIILLYSGTGFNIFLCQNEVKGMDIKMFKIISDNLNACFDKSGAIYSLNNYKMLSYTSLDDCTLLNGEISEQGQGIHIKKELVHSSLKKCTLTENIYPKENSIHWDIEIIGGEVLFTTAINTNFNFDDSLKFFSAWAEYPTEGKSEELELEGFATGDSNDSIIETVLGWKNPFLSAPFMDKHFYYGSTTYDVQNPRIGYVPFEKDVICFPFATVMDEKNDKGLSIVFSVEDIILDTALDVKKTGEMKYARFHHKIGDGNVVRLSMDIIVHEASFRGPFRFICEKYSKYMIPAVSLADNVAGCGAYSKFSGKLDVEKARKMGFRVNWKASFDFPYIGLFVPPVDNNAEWMDVKNERTSIQKMQKYSEDMNADGFYVLNYFNVTELGKNVEFPFPNREVKEGEEWLDASDFIEHKLKDAVLYSPANAPEFENRWMRAKPGGPFFTWMDSIVLDPGEPCYEDFLIDQAQKHVKYFKASSGICIDRMDWLRFYNMDRNDGVSFVDNKTCRSLYISWNSTMEKISEIFHKENKIVYCNNHVKRIDLLKDIDGFFDEFTYSGTSLNTTAMLGMKKAVMGWVSNDEQLIKAPDAFMQRFLYMGVFPMCPFPGNDHSINPTEWVEKIYMDYGKLFDLLVGKKWILKPDAVSVSSKSALANLFEVKNGSYLLPIIHGKDSDIVKVETRNIFKQADKWTFVAKYPSDDFEDIVLNPIQSNDSVYIDVQLKRECCVIYIYNKHGSIIV